jgi:hypothetical protein
MALLANPVNAVIIASDTFVDHFFIQFLASVHALARNK